MATLEVIGNPLAQGGAAHNPFTVTPTERQREFQSGLLVGSIASSMPIHSDAIKQLIDRELSIVSDHRVVSYVRGMLIEPYSIMRTWDYGEKGQQYPCWMALKDTASAAEIAYCEFGFGPKRPWGLVSSGDAPANQHMGMDSGWYTSFLDAFFESYASIALPIWRVFDGEQPWPGRPLTGESTWEDTWKGVKALKKTNPNGRYFAHHSFAYGEPPVQAN